MTTDAAPLSVTPNLIERVAAFNALAQTATPGQGFNADRVCFYTGMQLEEMAETLKCVSAGCLTNVERSLLADFAEQMQAFGKAFKSGKYQGAILRCDREELLDGAIDVLVVTTGSMIYQTPAYNNAVACVLDANDAKAPGGVVTRDADGKIQKPDNWVRPNLLPFVDQPID